MIHVQSNAILYDIHSLNEHYLHSGATCEYGSPMDMIEKGQLDVWITASVRDFKPIRCVLDGFASNVHDEIKRIISEDPDTGDRFRLMIAHESMDLPINYQYVIDYRPQVQKVQVKHMDSPVILLEAENAFPKNGMPLGNLYEFFGMETPPPEITTISVIEDTVTWINKLLKSKSDEVVAAMLKGTGLRLTTFAANGYRDTRDFMLMSLFPLVPTATFDYHIGRLIGEINFQRSAVKIGSEHSLMFRIDFIKENDGDIKNVCSSSTFTIDVFNRCNNIDTCIHHYELHRSWMNPDENDSHCIVDRDLDNNIWYKRGNRYYKGTLQTDDNGNQVITDSAEILRSEFCHVMK